jgi:hypothetical protein
MSLTDLINMLYTDIDGHMNECDCNICITMDIVQEYIQRYHLDKVDAGMVG